MNLIVRSFPRSAFSWAVIAGVSGFVAGHSLAVMAFYAAVLTVIATIAGAITRLGARLFHKARG